MRIDAFDKISRLYQTKNAQKIKKSSNISNPDRVEISQLGKDYQIAKRAVAAAPDIRKDKVNTIKESIASGTYDVSAEELVDKLLQNTFDLSV